jgi:hypothetical protein
MGKTFEHFTDWTNCSVTYKKFVSRDGVGKVTYASDNVILPCYIEGKTMLVKVDNAKEIISTERLYIDGKNSNVAGITENDLFIVNGRNRPILSLQPFYDEDGSLDFLVVML